MLPLAAPWRMIAGLAGLLVLVAPGGARAQAIGNPALSPAAVRVGVTSPVVVSTIIKQANVLPGGVNVVRVAPSGAATVIGVLNDAGTNGDVVAGDGVYAGRVSVTETVEGSIGLRTSVAIRGSLRRLQSATSTLSVVPASAPLGLSVRDTNQQTVDPATGAAIVANALNVCFTNTTPYASIVAILGQVGGTPIGRYSEIGNCYQVALTGADGSAIASAVAMLQSDPAVRYAEPEPIVHGAACAGPICPDVNYTTVLRLPQAQLYSQGSGVVIGILDSGLDAAILSPPVAFPTAIIGGNYSSSGAAGIARDDHGHGTLVAHIAQSTAPGSTLFIAKVLNANLAGSESASMLGMREAISNGAQIINLSLGSRTQTLLMRDWITAIQGVGVLVVGAAGNAGSSIREYPAAHLGVVAVGNVDERDRRFAGQEPSNFGPWVNIAAPGVNVAGLGTGTSYSTPFVAGTAAMVMSKFPGMSRPDVIAQLYRTALPIPFAAGLDTCPTQPCNQDLGSGRIDPEAALGAIRLTRVTAVGASGASIVRTIEAEVSSAGTNAVLASSQPSFYGQSTGCEVATVKNPPCISNLPYDFAALPAGQYLLRLSFRDPSASFFGTVRLNAPGAKFTKVRSGTASILASDPTQAEFSLFGAGVRTVFLEISKP